MNAAFLQEAARVLGPARVLIGLWFLLAVAQRLANGRSPALWGRGCSWGWSWLRLVFAAQALLAVGLIASTIVPGGGLVLLIACLGSLLLTQGVLLFVTGTFWADGSEKIGMIAMAGTLLIAAGVLVRDPALALAGALLAGGQVALCYAVAGISKMPVASWRTGRELAAVMGSRTFGHPGLAGVLARHRGIAVLASWVVILAEAAFPLALFAPAEWLAAALAVLFAFHLGTAVFMGLNTFPWAFAAAYPATWLLGHAVRGATG